jgi:secreted PhoX family phosphatase
LDFLTKHWITVPQDVVNADNPDVLRCWADTTLSPTSLWERPEDMEFDQPGKLLYFAVTEKSCTFDPATRRCAPGSELDGTRNRAGHVVRLDPETGDWSIFVDADTVNAQFGIQPPVFGNPDNLVLDHEGRLYIAQDGGDPNDSLWIATPDKDADGVADHFQRFLSMAEANLGVPASCGEPTGFMFLGEKTLLFNFQGGPRTNDFGVVDGANAESVACAPGGVAVPLSRIMRIELGGSDD